MAKNVFLDVDQYGRYFVREVLPDEAYPIEDWYNKDFASHCISAQDNVIPSMLYDQTTKEFYKHCVIEEDTKFQRDSIISASKQLINQI